MDTSHDSVPASAAYDPGRHAVSLSEPTGQNVPTPHTMQSFTLVITCSAVSLRVPPGQGSGEADPSEQ